MPNVCSSCDYQADDVVQDSCNDCIEEERIELLDAMPGDQELIEVRIQYMSERQTERGEHYNG